MTENNATDGNNGFWISMAVLIAFLAIIGFGFGVAFVLV